MDKNKYIIGNNLEKVENKYKEIKGQNLASEKTDQSDETLEPEDGKRCILCICKYKGYRNDF